MVVIMAEKYLLMPSLSNGGFMQGLSKTETWSKTIVHCQVESRQRVGCHVGFDIVGPPGLQYQICKIQLFAGGSYDWAKAGF